jgi:hypothetical protein
MKKGNYPAYGARVTITGEGAAISGGALIGCATPQNPSALSYAYVFQGTPYAVTGTPETNWSVNVGGTTYNFPASDRGNTWTAETMEVAVLPITINGIESGHSPGYLIYWPVAVDPSGYIDPPTSGSTGVYYDVHEDFHALKFQTTWSVPDFETVFSWNCTDPFGGPYLTSRNPSLGDSDTWVAGEPTPPGDPGTDGTR